MKYAILIWGLSVFSGLSQSLNDFTYLNEKYGADELYIGLNPTYTFVSNNAAPYPERHQLRGFSGDISMRKVNFQRGKINWNWQHKMFVDVFLLIGEALTGDPNAIYRNESTGLTCGVTGWLDFTWALNHPNGRFQVSLGVNHHDYFYGSTYTVDTISQGQWASFDPQGYFFAAGPVVKFNFLMSEWLMLECSNAYSFSYWKALDLTYATYPDADYPLPHFGQIDAEFQTKWGLFAGMNYNWIINRGNIPSAGKRLDLIAGFRFMI